MKTAPKVVTTDVVAPGERLDFWQAQIGSLLTHIECSSSERHTFSGLVKAHQSQPASLLEIDTATHAIARARPKISQVGEEQIFICIQVEGEAQVEQDSRFNVLKPGDITLLDTSRSFRAHFPGALLQHVIQVPRALVRKQIGAVENFTATIVPAQSTVGQLTRDFIGGLVRNFDKLDAVIAQRLTEQATEMALMAFMSSLGATGGAAPGSPSVGKTVLAHRGRAFIEQNLRHATLQPVMVAEHLGISKRYLNAIFAVHGQSVERFIWDRRLAKCARDLKDPNQSSRAIGDIAFSWGFHSLTHFSQAFKAKFGESPRAFRKTQIPASSTEMGRIAEV
ncbi:helix-turn-helix domain-containing protein [Paraburkholderia acidisoli]|uniref:helix-turn-helix domain-containing protein n=1 Tax=Paraburkholderia acidisoli TaxID=2571748 RepID=UPI00131DA330|nr:helix-turn-helix domain-containing protein [Paraburkholderia acidisoli]